LLIGFPCGGQRSVRIKPGPGVKLWFPLGNAVKAGLNQVCGRNFARPNGLCGLK
jgi:hypothetical protein